MSLDLRRFVHWVYSERVRDLVGAARVQVDAELDAPPLAVVREAVTRGPVPKSERRVPAFFANQKQSAAAWAAAARSRAAEA